MFSDAVFFVFSNLNIRLLYLGSSGDFVLSFLHIDVDSVTFVLLVHSLFVKFDLLLEVFMFVLMTFLD